MANPTLSDIVSRIRQRADIVNDGKHISDSDIKAYANTSIAAVYQMLAKGDSKIFGRLAGGLFNLGDNRWQLPSDHYKLLDVSVRRSGNWLRAEEMDAQEYAQNLDRNDVYSVYPRFQLLFNTDEGWFELVIFPTTAQDDILVTYLPKPPVLSLDAHELKLPVPDAVEWVILDAAVNCRIREESDPSAMMAEREKVEKRLIADIRDLTPNTPKTIRRTSRSRSYRRF